MTSINSRVSTVPSKLTINQNNLKVKHYIWLPNGCCAYILNLLINLTHSFSNIPGSTIDNILSYHIMMYVWTLEIWQLFIINTFSELGRNFFVDILLFHGYIQRWLWYMYTIRLTDADIFLVFLRWKQFSRHRFPCFEDFSATVST